MPKKNNDKMCPLLNRTCLKDDCELYEGMLKRCAISLNAYNTYRLSEVLKKILNPKIESGKEQKTPHFLRRSLLEM